MRAIGLMSGTSADGIDVAVIDVEDRPPDERGGFRLVHFATQPFAPDLRARLLASCSTPGTTIATIGVLNVDLGEALAAAVLDLSRRVDLDLRSVDVIGSHGHTAWHEPSARVTMQIGEPTIIAARTGITCVADFRAADVAVGGEGAPLVPFVDRELFGTPAEYRVCLNIGGIANVTLLPDEASGGDAAIRALDTGPGNMVIDACARLATDGADDFDRDGVAAGRGTPSNVLLDELLADPYFKRAAPKSTGRERFGAAFAAHLWDRGRELGLHPDDVLATATALTARTIAAQIPRACRRVIVSGGGAHNRTLMRMLQEAIGKPPAHARIEPSDDHGLPIDAKEAVAFALLAARAIAGEPNHLPACTGAKAAVILGTISPGDNYRSLMSRLSRGPGK